MQISGYIEKETLYVGPRSVVSRGVRESDGSSVILKQLSPTSLRIGDMGRYRYSFELMRDLKLDGVCRTYELLEDGERPTLVLEDLGGMSLRLWLDNEDSTSLLTLLKISIAASESLGQLHQENIIHKDINPGNFIYVPEDGRVQLIDFDLSSRLIREVPEAWDPSIFQGTMSYISPEQTGRMNRSIDHRADLYSLGVTLYEMFAGQRPFEETDGLALIHSHIAVAPKPLYEVNDAIPEVLSDIVMKLLSKMPEERYQSSYGLKSDLERCLENYATLGSIGAFPLGINDIFPRLRLSEKLYGRELEKEKLLEGFSRVESGNAELLLVSGFSGVGKSSLIREVQQPIAGEHGYFIRGKFDQVQNQPLATIIYALGELVRVVLSEPEPQILRWRREILAALGSSAQVMVDLVPELEWLLGEQPPVAPLPPTEAQNRFQHALLQFVKVFAKEEHPLALFLDDLQWANASTLKILKALITDPHIHYLYLIGAYRDNEVTELHPLAQMLHEIEGDESFSLNHLHLEPLQFEDTLQFVADSLARSPEDTQSLAEVMFSKTGGNPFFVERLLQELYDQGIVYLNNTEGQWEWDLPRAQSMSISENVAVLMSEKFGRLPEEAQSILMRAACIGTQFDMPVLATICEKSVAEVAHALWPALENELIVSIGKNNRFMGLVEWDDSDNLDNRNVVSCRFVHDRILETAYAQIEGELRDKIHLQVGQLLLQSTQDDTEQRERFLFEIINQMNRGHSYITSLKEREELARLNVQASKKILATANNTAMLWLEYGISLLAEDIWEREHDFAFELHRTFAEAAQLSGSFDVAGAQEDICLEHAKTKAEKVSIYMLRMKRLTILTKFDETLELGLKALEMFDFVKPTTPEEWQAAVMEEAMKIAEVLGDRSPIDLLDLDPPTDPEIITEITLLGTLSPASMLQPHVFPVVIGRASRLSAQYGNTIESPLCYVSYGFLLAAMGQLDQAEAFGQLAMQLNKKQGNAALRPAVQHLYATFICHWKHPFSDGVDYLQQAVSDGIEHGVFTSVGWALMNIITTDIVSGVDLTRSLSNALSAIDIGRNTVNYEQAATMGVSKAYDLYALLGSDYKEDLWRLQEKEPSQEEIYEGMSNYPMALAPLWNIRLVRHCVMGEWEKALADVEAIAPLISLGPGTVTAPIFYLYQSLVYVELYHQADEETQQRYRAEVEEVIPQCQVWAEHFPPNHQYRLLFLQAAIARMDGELFKASRLYNEAAETAKSLSYAHIEALALEQTAQCFSELKYERAALGYLRDAHQCYVRWGAGAKVAAMEEDYPHLRAQRALVPSSIQTRSFSVTTSSTTSGRGGHLDVQSVIKATRAISGEIVFDELLKALMSTMIESAGAERGGLLLRRFHQADSEQVTYSGDFCLEAEVSADGAAPSVMHEQELRPENIPLSVIRYVERSGKRVVLGDALGQGQFKQDPYIIKQKIKSLLCLPILKHNNMVGMLYLENNLTTDAFTAERCELLDVLAAQAAISIENSRLYSNMEDKVKERTAKLNTALEQVRKQHRQLQDTQAKLVQSEKMASLGTLVAGVAHELNNPANFSYSGAQNLNKKLGDFQNFLFELIDADEDSEIKAIFEKKFSVMSRSIGAISEGTKRIDQIVRDLRTFSRLDEAEQKEADVIEGLLSALTLVSAKYREEITFEQELNEPINMVCWPAQLNQVFLNILMNACQAITSTGKEGGKIHLSVVHKDGMHGISIEDNGIGMTEEVKARIFEPFFTTRTVGDGTGLGLSITFGIIEKHKGQIEVDSTPGEGTRVTVWLPAI